MSIASRTIPLLLLAYTAMPTLAGCDDARQDADDDGLDQGAYTSMDASDAPQPDSDSPDADDAPPTDAVADAAADPDALDDPGDDDVLGDIGADDPDEMDAEGSDADDVRGDPVADADVDAEPEPGAPPSPCPDHFAVCDGTCRAIEVDPDACGDCLTACPTGEICERASCTLPAAQAPPCDEAQQDAVLAAATADAPSVSLRCSLRLPPGSVITKAIRIAGAEASGVVLDCQGGTIVRGVPEGGADLVLIESLRAGDGWSRPTDVTVRNCRIEGSIRIRGQGNNGQAPDVTTDSWTPGHRERAQAAAPTRVLLEGLTIVGDGRIPLYLAPGATQVTLRDSEIVGESVSTLMYVDAESAYNRIINNRFAGDTRELLPREELAVDGAADNLIAGNVFEGVFGGGIFIYRNCGEGGAVRHQEPRRNVVAGNVFVLDGEWWDNAWLWVGSRNNGGLHRVSYCDLDEAYAFGSGASDLDFARDTVVVNNRFVDSPVRPDATGAWDLTIDDTPTYVEGNRRVAAATEPLGAVCVVFREGAPPLVVNSGSAVPDGRTCADGDLLRVAP